MQSKQMGIAFFTTKALQKGLIIIIYLDNYNQS